MSSSAAASYLTSSSPLWVAGRALLARRGIELFACWSRTGKSPDHTAIHELRNASRRVRECILFFSPCYKSGDSIRLSRKLNKLIDLLGAIRSIDEALLLMELIVEEVSPHGKESLGEMMHQLCLERKVAARRAGRLLRKTRRSSLAALFKELNLPPDLFGANEIDPFMPVRRYVCDRLRQTLTEMGPLATANYIAADGEARQRWNTAAKNLHKLLELLAPVMKRVPPEIVQMMLASYQELLRTLHDLSNFQLLLEKLVKDGDTLQELTRIITSKQTLVRIKLNTLQEEQPWERLLARIEECL